MYAIAPTTIRPTAVQGELAKTLGVAVLSWPSCSDDILPLLGVHVSDGPCRGGLLAWLARTGPVASYQVMLTLLTARLEPLFAPQVPVTASAVPGYPSCLDPLGDPVSPLGDPNNRTSRPLRKPRGDWLVCATLVSWLTCGPRYAASAARARGLAGQCYVVGSEEPGLPGSCRTYEDGPRARVVPMTRERGLAVDDGGCATAHWPMRQPAE